MLMKIAHNVDGSRTGGGGRFHSSLPQQIHAVPSSPNNHTLQKETIGMVIAPTTG